MRLLPKLLVPFLVLILAIGVVGAIFLVRDLASRARQDVEGNVRRLLGDGTSSLRIDEQYLEDSVYFAANLQGMAEAVEKGNSDLVADLADSVRVLRVNLNLFAIAQKTGPGLVELEGDDITKAIPHRGGDWSRVPFVASILRGDADQNGSFLKVRADEIYFLGVARAIRATKDRPVVGVAIAGIRLRGLVTDMANRLSAGVRIFDLKGGLIAAAGRVPTATSVRVAQGPHFVKERLGRAEITSGYADLIFGRDRIGSVAVSVPVGDALASAREAAIRLALMLLAVMAAVVTVGVVLSRLILAQVRPLVETNRALGKGDFTVRAPVLGDDELGELASGFNVMADQLQASVQELENRVAERTEELQRLYQDVQNSSKARSEFFTAMSHEFRTLLLGIAKHAELMVDPNFGSRDRKWKGEFGHVIKESCDHLFRLVNEILDMAKFESGKMEVNLAPVELPTVVSQLRGTMLPLAERSELRMTIDVARDLPAVSADVPRLREIILNLVSNAIKYTPSGGMIRLEARATNRHVEITVADSGVGIPKDEQPRVFEPFYRVKGTEPQRGQASSGLGLALAKRLVEAHGGEIWLASEPGAGTSFTFTLNSVPPGRRSRKAPNAASPRG
jgi:signal transduction histidine kinase